MPCDAMPLDSMRWRRLIILLKLEVCSGPTANIGNPVNFAEDPSASSGVRQS